MLFSMFQVCSCFYLIVLFVWAGCSVYSGWQLMGYAFAWRPTHEGTVKKGIQRILGTCLGGFCGWLGIIVCSWSYDDDAEINPYGLIAWLTIFSMLCAYFSSLASGVAAHFGKDQDHGYVMPELCPRHIAQSTGKSHCTFVVGTLECISQRRKRSLRWRCILDQAIKMI